MGYAGGIILEFLTIIAFVTSLMVCYGVILMKNRNRDLDHQIPILKAFLYALGWTPFALVCMLLTLKMMD